MSVMIFLPNQYRKVERLRITAAQMLLLIMVIFSTPVFADEAADRRIRAGLDLFPSLLAADLDIAHKKSREGRLVLVLLCVDKNNAVEKMVQHLLQIEKIKGIPVQVEISDDISFESYANHKPAGVFLTQPFKQEMDAIIEFTRKNHIISFSPFEGDVKRGILGGIMVSDRILPHINMNALYLSGIRLKSFFLRVSQRYEK